MSLRRLSQEEGYFTESEKGRQQFALKRVLGNNILNYGYCVTPDVVRPEMHPEQGPVWEWIYEHRDEFYERVHSNYRLRAGAFQLPQGRSRRPPQSGRPDDGGIAQHRNCAASLK